MKVLELFSGSKVLSETFEERGHDTFTVDMEEDYDPDLAADILELEVSDLPEEFQDADVVWASPPCTTFSVASLYRYWENGEPKNHKTYIGLAVAKKAFEIVQEIGPSYWFVENPRGMLRKQHFVKPHRRLTVTYCQYGEDYMKPTDIWTNSDWTARPRCSPGDQCHDEARRGESKSGGVQSIDGAHNTYNRSKLPVELCDEVARYCEGEPVNNHKVTDYVDDAISRGGGQ
jgi:hypothetical protein